MTEDEMAGWHHRLDGLEFECTPGVGDGQGGLACCNSWGRKESTGEGNGNPLQYSCLENPRNGGAWWAAFSGVAQSRTRLKRLSSEESDTTERLN